MLDLVTAITLGIVSANGSPLQLIHTGAGSVAVQLLPWSLIPTVLVPLFLDRAWRRVRATARPRPRWTAPW